MALGSIDSPAPPTNPLRDPRDRRLPRVPDPCAFVVFGVTGDLARKKLIPAVYQVNGDQLDISYQLGPGVRPRDFTSPAGSQILLVHYRRTH